MSRINPTPEGIPEGAHFDPMSGYWVSPGGFPYVPNATDKDVCSRCRRELLVASHFCPKCEERFHPSCFEGHQCLPKDELTVDEERCSSCGCLKEDVGECDRSDCALKPHWNVQWKALPDLSYPCQFCHETYPSMQVLHMHEKVCSKRPEDDESTWRCVHCGQQTSETVCTHCGKCDSEDCDVGCQTPTCVICGETPCKTPDECTPNDMTLSYDDAVDHPSHYGGAEDPYEVIKVLEAWMSPRDFRAFCAGNALKYLSRAGKKDPAKLWQDLEKAH